MAKERLVVIGGDAAGATAASQARRRRPADDLDIVVFERSDYTSAASCGLPFLVSRMVPDADALVARSPEEHRKRGVDVRVRHEVLEIDTGRRAVRARDRDAGSEHWEPFDHLVVATGATPTRPEWPGVNAEGVYGLQTLNDGVALRADVDDRDPQRAVVVGGGYIGLEVAEALVERGLDVVLVERASQPMPTLDPDMGALVADALRAVGVALHLDTPVHGFDVQDGRVRAVVTEHGSLPADLVVLGLGVRPDVRLADEAGIVIGASGGIAVDRRMRTSVPGVWSAGDCVESFHRVSRRPVTIALGTHANKQGRVAGINIGGGDAAFPGVVGTAMTRICAVEVARTGCNEREAAEAGFLFRTAVADTQTRAGYYPGAAPIKVKLVYEAHTGRVLGGQIVGHEGAAKRIDVLAAVIWNEMSVEELAGLDLGYAPPFSPVWDPVQQAARRAIDG